MVLVQVLLLLLVYGLEKREDVSLVQVEEKEEDVEAAELEVEMDFTPFKVNGI